MLLCDIARSVANEVRLRTVYAGIGRRASGVLIGRQVRLVSRKYIQLGRRVHIGDFCRIFGGSRPDSISIGDGTVIHDFCILRTSAGEIQLGRECSLNPYCVVLGEDVAIGNHVRIASHTVIAAENHIFDRLDVPIASQGCQSRGIVIEDDVWIGAGCAILDGVTIGTGAVIGAGSVVTKDVEQFSVVAGTPARLIRMRTAGQGPAPGPVEAAVHVASTELPEKGTV